MSEQEFARKYYPKSGIGEIAVPGSIKYAVDFFLMLFGEAQRDFPNLQPEDVVIVNSMDVPGIGTIKEKGQDFIRFAIPGGAEVPDSFIRDEIDMPSIPSEIPVDKIKIVTKLHFPEFGRCELRVPSFTNASLAFVLMLVREAQKDFPGLKHSAIKVLRGEDQKFVDKGRHYIQFSCRGTAQIPGGYEKIPCRPPAY